MRLRAILAVTAGQGIQEFNLSALESPLELSTDGLTFPELAPSCSPHPHPCGLHVRRQAKTLANSLPEGMDMEHLPGSKPRGQRWLQ